MFRRFGIARAALVAIAFCLSQACNKASHGVDAQGAGDAQLSWGCLMGVHLPEYDFACVGRTGCTTIDEFPACGCTCAMCDGEKCVRSGCGTGCTDGGRSDGSFPPDASARDAGDAGQHDADAWIPDAGVALEDLPRSYGGNENDFFDSIETIESGGFVVSGWTESYGVTGADGWLLRLDDKGDIERQFVTPGAYANHVVPDGSGGLWGAGVVQNVSANRENPWLFRLDANWNFIWQKEYVARSTDFGYSIANVVRPARDGGAVAVIEVSTDSNFHNYRIIKVDGTGELEWNQFFRFAVTDIAESSEGGFVAVGSYVVGNSWDGIRQDIIVFKLNPNGMVLWTKLYDLYEREGAHAVFATPDEGCVVVGWSESSTVTHPQQVWVLKLAPDGAIEWQTALGNNEWPTWYGGIGQPGAVSVLQTPDGGFVFAGLLQPKDFEYDAWLVKLSPSGALEWQRTYGGDAWDDFTAVRLLDDGSFVAGGTTSSFVHGTCGNGEKCSDILIARFGPDGSIEGTCPATFGEFSHVSVHVPTGRETSLGLTYDESLFDVIDTEIVVRPTESFSLSICTLDPRCTDGCTSSSKVECVDETRYRRCERQDQEYCLGWSESRSCGVNSSCRLGVCTCEGRFQDCDRAWDTGCETDLLIDPDNCGFCNHVCEPSNVGNRLCNAGNCDYDKCASGFLDGNHERTDGCEAWDVPPKVFFPAGAVNSNSFVRASDGTFLLAGDTLASAPGNECPPESQQPYSCSNAWAVKVDAAGRVLWEKAFGDSGQEGISAALPVPDGGFLAIGKTASAARGLDVWIARLNDNGDIITQLAIGGAQNDSPRSAVATADGGLVVSGGTEVEPYRDAPFLLKLDAQLNVEWQTVFDMPRYAKGTSVVQTPDGGFMMAGVVATEVNPWSPRDVFLLKAGPGGEFEQLASYTNGDDNQVCGLVTADSGGVFLLGRRSPDSGDADLWLAGIGGAGDIEWQRSYGGANEEWCSGLTKTADGQILVAATTSSFGTTDYDEAAWVLKLDREGNPIWQLRYKYADSTSGGQILEIPDGRLAVTAHVCDDDVGYVCPNALWYTQVTALGAYDGNGSCSGELGVPTSAVPGISGLVEVPIQATVRTSGFAVVDMDFVARGTLATVRSQCKP